MSTYSPIIHPVANVQAMAHFNLNKVTQSHDLTAWKKITNLCQQWDHIYWLPTGVPVGTRFGEGTHCLISGSEKKGERGGGGHSGGAEEGETGCRALRLHNVRLPGISVP